MPIKSKLKQTAENENVVIDFIEASKHPLKSSMMSLREIIRSADPRLTEHIKWNAPSFCLDGIDRITYNIQKNEMIMIVFHRGASHKDTRTGKRFISDPSGLLEWASDSRAILKLKSANDVATHSKAIKEITKRWLAKK